VRATAQLQAESLSRFQKRLADAETMRDTQLDGTENALLRRSLGVLTKRIEELEAEIDTMRGELIEAVPDLERIASTLRTFYFAELTASAIQPILALTLELNPDIVEQRR
jgi:hypothetical protein